MAGATRKSPAKGRSRAKKPSKARPAEATHPVKGPTVQADDPDKPRKYRVYTSPPLTSAGRAITPFATPTSRGSMSPWARSNARRGR